MTLSVKLKITLPILCVLLVGILLYTYQHYQLTVLKKNTLVPKNEEKASNGECQCQCPKTQPSQCLAPTASFSQGTQMPDTKPPATLQIQETDKTSPLQHTESLSPPDPVQSSEKIRSLLLTLVLSAPMNKDRRDVIRRTWKNSYTQPGKQFRVKFVIGTLGLEDQVTKSLWAEDEQHNDMLLLTDHVDGYHNLTRKVLYMFVWADQNVDFSYLLKADDDAFVRLDAVESELKKRDARKPAKPLYWGYILRGVYPQKAGKWKEVNWDICDKYLPYAQGGGYVLSAELIHRVAINADGCRLYANEDTAVSAWTSPFKLDRISDSKFDMTSNQKPDKKCETYFLMTGQSIEAVEKRHEKLSTPGFCKQS